MQNKVEHTPTWASVVNTKCSGGGASGSALESGAILEIWSDGELIIHVSFEHIVKAVNEHAALNAVAEAGELMLMRMKSEISRFPVAEKLKRSRFIERMESSLSTLQSIRKGEGV